MKRNMFPAVIVFLLVVLFQVVAFAGPTEYVGYLSDVKCAVKGTAGDGANLQTNPEKHTVACMKMPGCAASGYGVLVKDEKGGKYVFHKFDAKGNEIAKKLLKTTKRTDNMNIMVKGVMGKDAIKVETIVEQITLAD
jgi:hypothetical protein